MPAQPTAIKNQAKPGRYVVLLKSHSNQAIKKVQKELGVQLTSSEELSDTLRAHQVLDSNTGLLFNHLNIAVVDNIEEAKLQRAATSSSAVLYWEEEREFRTANELEQLREIKQTQQLLQQQIEQLEEMIKVRENENGTQWETATWGVNAVALKKDGFTGKGVNVAVLDTGLYAAHPDFAGRVVEGKSFIPNEAWDADGNGHGTHCVGTALGSVTQQDGKRYGMAHEATMVIGKVLSDRGSGSTSGIVDAIDWALEKKCRIVSLSLGSPVRVGQAPSPIFEQVGRKALENNCLLIAAAGNDSRRPNMPRPVSSPANAESIMAVAAVDRQLNVASFSNGGINAGDGGKVDIAAPGVDVFSTYSENASDGALYVRLSGTSMATPHVAGIAALYCEAFPSLSAAEIWLKLEKNVKSLPDQLIRDVGQGLVQAI
ncbi:S8 family serine peptidase [Tunicatimonas pelagia]|uniref:S8 family serine peptidase n=1 Tax=Tunicatimonas pelagia TaxID=931531 RepID=UPI0026664EAC|nr:S8 family serine peptidase [Tunicatimonas pelagia]WKN44617.1 S8 family serine peptidase [Tunicatimonas pelagia]